MQISTFVLKLRHLYIFVSQIYLYSLILVLNYNLYCYLTSYFMYDAQFAEIVIKIN